MISLTGLWKAKKKDKNGHDFYTANLGGITIFLFKNQKKFISEKQGLSDKELTKMNLPEFYMTVAHNDK